jgi:hypothetical protein
MSLPPQTPDEPNNVRPPSEVPASAAPVIFKQISVELPEEVAMDLKRMALDNRTTASAIVADALALVYAKLGRPVPFSLAQVGRKPRGRPPRS